MLLVSLLAARPRRHRPSRRQRRPPSTGSPFRERARELGLVFHHFNGATGKLYFSEMMGPGVGLIDADGDGDYDVVALQGAPLDGTPARKSLLPPAPGDLPLRTRIFRNLLKEKGELRFEDATEASGLRSELLRLRGRHRRRRQRRRRRPLPALRRRQPALAQRRQRPFRRRHRRRRRRRKTLVGLGDLLRRRPRRRPGPLRRQLRRLHGRQRQTLPGPDRRARLLRSAHPPPGRRPLLRERQGDGKFADRTAEAGFAAVAPGSALGVVDGDFNHDGWPDLFVANDGMPNYLWQNRGNGTFEERALEAGASVNAAGQAEANMGIAAGDPDNDLDEDLLLTHLTLETSTFYRNLGQGFFEDATTLSGLGAPEPRNDRLRHRLDRLRKRRLARPRRPSTERSSCSSPCSARATSWGSPRRSSSSATSATAASKSCAATPPSRSP